jgi:hypothetical protein
METLFYLTSVASLTHVSDTDEKNISRRRHKQLRLVVYLWLV